MLIIKNLSVKVGNKKILNGLNLELELGKKYALLGPNGNGKSTLLQVIMGNPKYQITSGEIFFLDKNIIHMEPHERSRLGIFLSFQNPPEIDGIANLDLLRTLINSKNQKKTSIVKLYNEINGNKELLSLPHDYLDRSINTGFSGGEKKNNEIMQLNLLKPVFAMIDEVDSGVDSDGIKKVASSLKRFYNNNKSTLLIISHYEELYKNLDIDEAYVLINGSIVMSGSSELITKINVDGYDWIYNKLGLDKNSRTPISIESCAIYEKTSK